MPLIESCVSVIVSVAITAKMCSKARLGLWLSKTLKIGLIQAIGAEKNELKVEISFFKKCKNSNFFSGH